MKTNINGANIYYIDNGKGDPWLFLHGNPDSSAVWHEIIAHLSLAHRCIAPDLPGFGYSEIPQNFDFSLNSMSNFIECFLSNIGVMKKITLVVHDAGGFYGFAWTVNHSDKISKIIIMNTAFDTTYQWHTLARLWRIPIVGEIIQTLTNQWAFKRELKRSSRKLSDQQIEQTYKRITPSMKKAILKLYRAMDPLHLEGWDTQLRTQTVAIPKLVLWGRCDPYIPEKFAHSFGVATVKIYDQIGHWTPIEAITEVVQDIDAFIIDIE